MAVDDSWKQLQQVNEIVRYADAKAGLVLTVNGILIGLVSVRIQSGDLFRHHPVPAATLALSVVFLACSLGFDIAAIMPRLSAPGQNPSLLQIEFVGTRYVANQDDYLDELGKLVQDETQLRRELGVQIWANSMVARRKYAYVRQSLQLLAAALAAVVLAAVVGAFGG